MKTVTATLVMSAIWLCGCAVDEGQTIKGTVSSYLVPKEVLRDKFRYAFMRSIRGDGKKVVSLQLASTGGANSAPYRVSIYHDPAYVKRRGMAARVEAFIETARQAGKLGSDPLLYRYVGRHGKGRETWYLSFDPASGEKNRASDFIATQPRKQSAGSNATCTVLTMVDGLLIQMAVSGEECALGNFAKLAKHARDQLKSWRI